VNDRALALAARVIKLKSKADEQIKQAFQFVLGREPTYVELTRMTAYLAKVREYHTQNKPAPVTYPTRITRSLVEEFSGKAFEYEEILPRFASYLPDTKPDQVDADTRAMADVCLLLLNTHEFMYVR
jgi:hypothetical protein